MNELPRNSFTPEHNGSDIKPINVPEGKMASPELGFGYKPLGSIEGNEFLMLDNIEDPGALDLYVNDSNNNLQIVMKSLLNFDDDSHTYQLIIYPNKGLKNKFKKLNEHMLDQIIDNYLYEFESSKKLYIEKKEENSNNHLIRTHEFNGKDVELIHQQREGDCILANVLNTYSFEKQGHLPYTIIELRERAIQLRRNRGEDTNDIEASNSHLSYKDYIYLLADLFDEKPQQKNIITVEGRNQNMVGIQRKICDILEDLIKSKTKILATGLGYHARSIKYLGNNYFAILDPMNRNGAKSMSYEKVIEFLGNMCKNRDADSNFFYIVG